MKDLAAMLACVVLVVSTSLIGAAARADQPGAADAAERRVAAMIRQVDALSRRADLPDAVLASRFSDIMAEYLDRASMARAALGEAARRLTRDERQRFLEAYSTHLNLTFVRGVREIGASSTRLLGSRVAPDGTIYVITRSTTASAEDDAAWMMCRTDPGRICDVEVDGVLASAHQRSSFADRLRAKGLDGLIRALEAGWLVETP